MNTWGSKLSILIRRFTSTTVKTRPGYIEKRINPKMTKLESQEFRNIFTPQLHKLADLFKSRNYELRIAGGAVRDLLMGKIPSDLDFASTATPTEMKTLFEEEGIRMLHKRGEEHGTITCRLDDKENFEITTLRIDVLCDGRRAEVQYTTDWQLDANRRDLTINSLFLDLDGNVIDYFGGVNDIEKRRVAFVGDAAKRIQEDYLRILRYFRFFGRISDTPDHEEATLEAIRANKDGLRGISAERIWTELKKIVVGRMAPQVMRCMLDGCQLNSYLGLPVKCNLDRFERVFTRYASKLEPMTMVASLCEKAEEVEEFHRKTKLANVERILGEFVLTHRAEAENRKTDLDWWKGLLVDLEVQPGATNDNQKISGHDRICQLAMSVCLDESLIEQLSSWTLPVFPVKGTDLMTAGVKNGPKMRNTLTYLYELWKKSCYKMSQADLLSHAHDENISDAPPPKGKKRKRQESK